MLVGDFQQKIRQLNPRLRFLSTADESKPIGLFYMGNNEITSLCGTDRNEVPEFMQYSWDGHIVKAGWRRTVEILIQKGLTTRRKATDVFGSCFFCRTGNTKFVKDLDPVGRAIKAAGQQSVKTMIDGKPVDSIPMKRDDIMDISRMIKKNEEKENAA